MIRRVKGLLGVAGLFGCTLIASSMTAGCSRPDPVEPVSANPPPSAEPIDILTEAVIDDPPGDQTEESDLVTVDPAPIAPEAVLIVEAADRTEQDRERDVRRHPGQLLTFLEVKPGMRVADLGAGDGYTTELLARAVGEKGVVYAQNSPYTVEKFVKESWPKRLERFVMKNVVRVDREFADPLPKEATDLDLVTILFSYHDVVGRKKDVAAMNAAVFRALEPGGTYVIADHSAKPGSGPEVAAELHRIDEALVRKQVEEAGFVLISEAGFLRDPKDTRTQKSSEIEFETDRFLLKFQKPAQSAADKDDAKRADAKRAAAAR